MHDYPLGYKVLGYYEAEYVNEGYISVKNGSLYRNGVEMQF